MSRNQRGPRVPSRTHDDQYIENNNMDRRRCRKVELNRGFSCDELAAGVPKVDSLLLPRRTQIFVRVLPICYLLPCVSSWHYLPCLPLILDSAYTIIIIYLEYDRLHRTAVPDLSASARLTPIALRPCDRLRPSAY